MVTVSNWVSLLAQVSEKERKIKSLSQKDSDKCLLGEQVSVLAIVTTAFW